MRKKKYLKNIFECIGSIAREIVELKLGMIKTKTCEKVSQEEVNEYLDEEYI